MAKPASAIQLSNAQVVILPQDQVQETQGSKIKLVQRVSTPNSLEKIKLSAVAN